MNEPCEVADEEHEQIVARVAAVDVAKASGMVCTRVPHDTKAGRRLSKVWNVPATTNAVIELADHLAPRSTPFRVPTGLGEAIDKRIAPAGLDALHLLRAIRDVNKDVPDNPDKLDAVTAAILKLKKSLVPLAAEVGIQVGFR